MTDTRFRRAFLLWLVIGISAAFIAMIWPFLLTIVLAAIFSGISYPVYRWLLPRVGRREWLAALVTLLLVLAIVVLPLATVFAAAANEALRVTESIGPQLQQFIGQPGELDRWLRALPGYDRIAPYREQILIKAGELASAGSAFLFAALSATTRATAVFVFQFVVMLYAMFFFLKDGPLLLKKIFAYLPLSDTDKERMLEKFVSVTQATLKGTVLIGAGQGALGGVAFWAVGLEGAVFWGTIMTVLSIVPGIGGALVWVPAVIYLAITGAFWKAIGVTIWCSLVVGSIDNLLRPRLVSRDIQMHELMIFFSTLGGISLFGVMGFILGPILAALFVTVWEMFGIAFRHAIVTPEDRPNH